MTTSVLICDDSAMARKQIARALPAGWDVAAAAGGGVFAERLRREVEAAMVMHEGVSMQVTISLGIAGLGDGSRPMDRASGRGAVRIQARRRNRYSVFGA